jgi:hypothetical protein
VGRSADLGRDSGVSAVVEAGSRILGPDHPHTLGARDCLGNILTDRGQYSAAEPELRAVVEARTQALGPEALPPSAAARTLPGRC